MKRIMLVVTALGIIISCQNVVAEYPPDLVHPPAWVHPFVLSVIKPGGFAGGEKHFIFKPRTGEDQYWLLLLKETEAKKYLVLLLDGECSRNIDYPASQEECVMEERWSSLRDLHELFKKTINPKNVREVYSYIAKKER